MRLSAASRAEDGIATDTHCLPKLGHIQNGRIYYILWGSVYSETRQSEIRDSEILKSRSRTREQASALAEGGAKALAIKTRGAQSACDSPPHAASYVKLQQYASPLTPRRPHTTQAHPGRPDDTLYQGGGRGPSRPSLRTPCCLLLRVSNAPARPTFPARSRSPRPTHTATSRSSHLMCSAEHLVCGIREPRTTRVHRTPPSRPSAIRKFKNHVRLYGLSCASAAVRAVAKSTVGTGTVRGRRQMRLGGQLYARIQRAGRFDKVELCECQTRAGHLCDPGTTKRKGQFRARVGQSPASTLPASRCRAETRAALRDDCPVGLYSEYMAEYTTIKHAYLSVVESRTVIR